MASSSSVDDNTSDGSIAAVASNHTTVRTSMEMIQPLTFTQY